MKTYESCPFKYFLNYSVFAPQRQHFAAELGTVLHLVLERYAQAFINGKDFEGNDKEWLDKNWKKLILKEGFRGLKSWTYNSHILKEKKSCESCKAFKNDTCQIVGQKIESFEGCPWNTWVEACNMVLRVIKDETEHGVFSDPSKIIATEQEFLFDIEIDKEKYSIKGFIDLVLEVDDETVEVVDYKTGRHKMSPSAAEKDAQLMLYYLAAKLLYPEKKNHLVTIFYLHEKKRQITPPFDEFTDKKIKDRICYVWNSIKNDEDPVRIADKQDGSYSPTHVCKYLCNWDLCQVVHKKFREYRDAGGSIDFLTSLKDLGVQTDDEGNVQ